MWFESFFYFNYLFIIIQFLDIQVMQSAKEKRSNRTKRRGEKCAEDVDEFFGASERSMNTEEVFNSCSIVEEGASAVVEEKTSGYHLLKNLVVCFFFPRLTLTKFVGFR